LGKITLALIYANNFMTLSDKMRGGGPTKQAGGACYNNFQLAHG
jgi:hypothetical protein